MTFVRGLNSTDWAPVDYDDYNQLDNSLSLSGLLLLLIVLTD